jgi:hypothetical protein
MNSPKSDIIEKILNATKMDLIVNLKVCLVSIFFTVQFIIFLKKQASTCRIINVSMVTEISDFHFKIFDL